MILFIKQITHKIHKLENYFETNLPDNKLILNAMNNKRTFSIRL